jgi:hypothetical protein
VIVTDWVDVPEKKVLGEGTHKATGPLITGHVNPPDVAAVLCQISLAVAVPFAFTVKEIALQPDHQPLLLVHATCCA